MSDHKVGDPVVTRDGWYGIITKEIHYGGNSYDYKIVFTNGYCSEFTAETIDMYKRDYEEMVYWNNQNIK